MGLRGLELVSPKNLPDENVMPNRFFLPLMLALLLGGSVFAEDARELKVALTGKYPPFSMYDANGELVGFDVDVARAVAERLGRTATFVPTEWDGILPGLLSGKYDVIIGSMAITAERREQVNFSSPYYESGAQLFIHSDRQDELHSIEDCGGLRLGVVLGESFEQYLREKHPEIVTVTYKSTVDIFADVRNGRLSGFVSDRLLGAYQIKEHNQPFLPAGPVLYSEEMGIPVVKERPDLLSKVNGALDEMDADGELDRLFSKWFGLQASPGEAEGHSRMRPATIIRMLGLGFAVTLLIALASITIGFLLAVPEGIVLNNPRIFGYRLIRLFNDFLRGTPVLIQLFFVYFGVGGWLAARTGINIPAVLSAILTLGLNASAYMAEVVRSGLMAVPRGQREAAAALGFNPVETFRYIVWPQAFRIALPPLVNSVVALIKDTALVSVITVAEVVRQAQSIISVTFDPVRYYLIVAVMFFCVTFPLMKISGRLEARIRSRGYK